MHFSIPDTQEFLDNTGSVYVGYNIHINGLFHCTVRYKQLHNLHEQLAKDLDSSLAPFPPKKFFPLTSSQQEERRLALEKYIQTIGQNTAINRSELLNGFFLNAQVEIAGHTKTNEDLDVFLMNGQKFVFNVSIGEHSGLILKKICRHIKLPEQYDSYFSLFIMLYENNGDVNIFRKLQDFESPVLTLRNIQKNGSRIVLGKWYWDIGYDIKMMKDVIALNLLYIQATAEVERGWILMPEELKKHLGVLRNNDEQKDFLDIARSSKYYGYIQFAPCFCDYPQPRSKVRVAIGRSELNLRISTEDEEEKEAAFRVTHMRCWRITTVHNETDKNDGTTECNLELSFEYLVAKNQLVWITIASDQAILMSVCIQSMIDELLLKNVTSSRNQESSGKSWTYLMKDGHSRMLIGSSLPENLTKSRENEEISSHVKTEPIMKKLTERFSSMNRRRSSKSNSLPDDNYSPVEYDSRENKAFRVIGDDDL